MHGALTNQRATERELTSYGIARRSKGKRRGGFHNVNLPFGYGALVPSTPPHRKPTVEGNLRGASVWGGGVEARAPSTPSSRPTCRTQPTRWFYRLIRCREVKGVGGADMTKEITDLQPFYKSYLKGIGKWLISNLSSFRFFLCDDELQTLHA